MKRRTKMRHRIDHRKLGRTASHRKALFSNQAVALFRHEKIRTTEAKGKELRRIAERLITLAKKNTLHSRRQAAIWVRDQQVLKKLFDEIGPRYVNRNGGYTRIVKIAPRIRDDAPMAYVELV
jgi:large subunit ribosomal protein L17